MKNNYLIKSISIVLFIVIFLFTVYYFFVFSSSIAVVTLLNKDNSSVNFVINVEFDNGERKQIEVDKDIWDIMKEDNKYIIKYKYNLFRKPHVVEISQSN